MSRRIQLDIAKKELHVVLPHHLVEAARKQGVQNFTRLFTSTLEAFLTDECVVITLADGSIVTIHHKAKDLAG